MGSADFAGGIIPLPAVLVSADTMTGNTNSPHQIPERWIEDKDSMTVG